MNFKQIPAAVALVGIAVASQSAVAGVIVATYAGSANFGSGPVGYDYGSVVPNPASNSSLVGVGIGGDSFTSADHTYDFSQTGQFNAWCVDIYHWMNGGTVTYTVAGATDLASELNLLRPGSPSGTQRVNQLVQLADEVYGSVDTRTDSAAFQLAVWAIAYGTADSSGIYHINTTDPNLRVDGGTATSADGNLANAWLNNLNTAQTTGHYTLAYLSDGRQENTQDVLVFTAGGSGPAGVPEPATIALIGLGGLGLIRRKKAR